MDDTGGLQREGRTRYIFGRDQFNRRVQTIQKHALQHTRLVLGSKQSHLALARAIVDGAAIQKTRLRTLTEQLRTGIKSNYSCCTFNRDCRLTQYYPRDIFMWLQLTSNSSRPFSSRKRSSQNLTNTTLAASISSSFGYSSRTKVGNAFIRTIARCLSSLPFLKNHCN